MKNSKNDIIEIESLNEEDKIIVDNGKKQLTKVFVENINIQKTILLGNSKKVRYPSSFMFMALSLFSKSRKAYIYLKEEKVLMLPSLRHIQRYAAVHRTHPNRSLSSYHQLIEQKIFSKDDREFIDVELILDEKKV